MAHRDGCEGEEEGFGVVCYDCPDIRDLGIYLLVNREFMMHIRILQMVKVRDGCRG